MNSSKSLVVAASFLSCALLSMNAQAQYNVSADNIDPTLFGNEGGWTSGDVTIPGGATIGSTPIELDLTLSHDLTLTSIGFGYNYGFFMNGFDPQIAPSGDAFTFSIELLENGTILPSTPTFADDLASPFTFGFDEANPFSFSVNNLGVTTSTTALPNTLTFDQVDILVGNSNPGGEAVTDFSVQLGVVTPVPDISNTLSLLFLGLAPLFGFGYRKVTVVRCQE